ncbi:MAG: hypothetical protein JRI95_16855 [Deltaproteobacteria bacterium]|nr:hypothetical protein [Deltaproteobacteria bacterium]
MANRQPPTANLDTPVLRKAHDATHQRPISEPGNPDRGQGSSGRGVIIRAKRSQFRCF